MANLRFQLTNSVVNTKLPVIHSNRRSTTVSLETYPLYLLVSKIDRVKKECFKQKQLEKKGVSNKDHQKKLVYNIVTLLSKKLPEVHTECRAFWEREGGLGDNEKYGKDSLMFCFVLFCFLLISIVLHLSSTNILCNQKCTFEHHHLRYRQRKGLNNQDVKNSISKT